MMRWKKYRDINNQSLKLAITYDTNTVAVMGLNLPAYEICYARKFNASEIKEIASDLRLHELHHCPAMLILPENYQVTLIDIPSEIYVNFHNDIMLRNYMNGFVDPEFEVAMWDYIEVPSKKKVSPSKNYYIIAVKKNIILERIDFFKRLGVKISNVQVFHSVLISLVKLLVDGQESLFFIYSNNVKVYIFLMKEGIVHMMRVLDLELNNDETQFRVLSEELQRTNDYCNSNLEKFVPTRFVLAGMPEVSQNLLSRLSDFLGLPGRAMTVAELVKIKEGITLTSCLDIINLGGVFLESTSK